MRLAAAIVALTVGSAMAAETGTFTVRLLTPETALKAAQAALAKCRAGGFQVTVVVVDRSGLMQALLRDRFAAPHTIETARLKAQTAVNFRMDTGALDREMQPGRPTAGLRQMPYVLPVAGGRVFEAGGSLAGAIGVSGAPGPANDDVCAQAALEAIAEDLEF
jgi:uncharacterized protein GlcG (DUF336 family)